MLSHFFTRLVLWNRRNARFHPAGTTSVVTAISYEMCTVLDSETLALEDKGDSVSYAE